MGAGVTTGRAVAVGEGDGAGVICAGGGVTLDVGAAVGRGIGATAGVGDGAGDTCAVAGVGEACEDGNVVARGVSRPLDISADGLAAAQPANITATSVSVTLDMPRRLSIAHIVPTLAAARCGPLGITSAAVMTNGGTWRCG